MGKQVWVELLPNFEVNERGEVRSLSREVYSPITQHKGKRVVHGRMKKLQHHKKTGYVMVHAGEKLLLVHRLVAKAFIPNPNNLAEVNHKDGNKKNNHVSNLEWVTRHQNARHAHDNGVYDHRKKLTANDVIEIRRLYSEGVEQKVLGEKYGVTQVNISSVVRRKTWATV